MIGILMRIISLIASFPVVVAGTFYFFKDLNIFVELLLGIAIAMIVIFIFRAIFRKERPNIHGLNKHFLHNRMTRSKMRVLRDKFLELEKRSFASAHVARIGVYAAVLHLNGFPFDWTLSLLAFMVLVGLARLYLKRHSFFDLITGAAIGLAAGYVAFTVITRYIFFI